MEKIANIRMIRTLGIISAMILILYYLTNVAFLGLINETIKSFILTLALVTFYFEISRYIQLYGLKVEVLLIRAIIIVEILSWILQILNYYSPNFSGFALYIFPTIIFVLFMLFGIKTLKINTFDKELAELKRFIYLMFIAYMIIAIGILILIAEQKIEFIDWVFTIYVIPYTYGLAFFTKVKNKNQ